MKLAPQMSIKSFVEKTSNRAGLKLPASICAAALVCLFSFSVRAQQNDAESQPVVVQPGAPGQPTKTLPPSTKAILPPRSLKDAEFMRGMIMHHAQAVEMTALIETRTTNKDLLRLGKRISQTQSDEINFMKRWLESRGELVRSKTEISDTHMSEMHKPAHHKSMPGMLSPDQMNALKKANGADFDKLFLKGMIQHHKGALDMVKDLFETPGAGQDAELFNFATDVDGGQRAEIKVMQTMLGENP